VLVIAILHLVGGSLGVLGVACTAGLQGIQASQSPRAAQAPEQRIEEYIERSVPGYQFLKWGSIAFSLLLSLMMIVAGLGLIWMQPWARYLSLTYAVLSILWHIFDAVTALGFILPATTEFLDREMAHLPGQAPGFSAGMKVGMYFGALFSAAFIAYPIVVLCLLLRPSIARAFSGEGLPPDEGRDRGGEWGDVRDDDRPRDRWGEPEADDRYR
jgi:hypothetical protein